MTSRCLSLGVRKNCFCVRETAWIGRHKQMSRSVKRVLVVTDLLQASPRFPGIANYLLEYGWEATVVSPPINRWAPHIGTPHDDLRGATKLVETPEYKQKPDRLHQVARAVSRDRDLDAPIWKFGRVLYHRWRRLYELLVDQFLWFPDAEKHWRDPALKTCRKLLAESRFDVLLSSSSPVTSHIVACVLHRESGLPWVADLRDLWTQNHVYRFSLLRKFVERRLEIATLKAASTLLTVSQPLVDTLNELHRSARVIELPNGFDPVWYEGADVPLTEQFTITYTGQIYPRRQDPSLILQALYDLIEERYVDRETVRVRFYGPPELSVKWEARRLHIDDIIEQHGIVRRRVVVQRQRESQLLLVFNWEDARQRGGIIMQKTFDYVGARRPILATGGHRGDLREDLIRQGQCGMYCPTLAEVTRALRFYYTEYRERGRVVFRGRNDVVGQYSYRRRAEALSNELSMVISDDRQRVRGSTHPDARA